MTDQFPNEISGQISGPSKSLVTQVSTTLPQFISEKRGADRAKKLKIEPHFFSRAVMTFWGTNHAGFDLGLNITPYGTFVTVRCHILDWAERRKTSKLVKE